MIDYEQLQDYIYEFDNVVECDITVGTITFSTETSCRAFAMVKLVYDTISAGNQECESCMYNWSIDYAVAACLNDIALKVSNLSIDVFLRGIAACLSCTKGE